MENGIHGNEAVVQVKTNSGLYPKQFIEDALADAPRGICIVLAGVAPRKQKMIAVSYHYSHKTTLFSTHDCRCWKQKTRPSIHHEIYR